MSKQMPPVPPAARNSKGSGGSPEEDVQDQHAGKRPVNKNLAEQGRQGNIKQNTTNRGYQQDR